MQLTPEIEKSHLFFKLCEDEELKNALLLLRNNAATLAATISRSVPTFTDHSIRHMDALWSVTERVLKQKEISEMTPAEAFLLAAAFYLHDIGMAYAATDEGLSSIRASQHYRAMLAMLKEQDRPSPASEARAVAFAVRKIHAEAAKEFATKSIPGTDVFLLEPRAIRDAWSTTCGLIAASHHWNLERVERELGSLQSTALPGGRKGDLGYVAAVLRIVDYAHINRDRASTIERMFRLKVQEDSLVHWLAQEQIDGPERDEGCLVYRAATPMVDVDAWWLYYDMLKGLDAEIRAVKRHLDKRASSHGRFSLESVEGANSPEDVAEYIKTDGFMPLEVNIRTGSIERLVQLLAGESLYGKDSMAPVRELIQNARDAVSLKTVVARTPYEQAALSLPIRVALTSGIEPFLEVTDWGVGMTKTVMTEYLITLASDYWTGQFHLDFPDARGFSPAGKFGIGFLSVFMLGDQVTVESNRAGGERYELRLSGVGRRGEIRALSPQSGSGTAVRIKLKPTALPSLQPLLKKIMVYAPMLNHPLEVSVDDQSSTIAPRWLFQQTPADFEAWTIDAVQELRRNRDSLDSRVLTEFWYDYGAYRAYGAHMRKPRVWKTSWPEYVEDKVRLVASFGSISLLCLKGLALQPIRTPGFVGVIDLDTATPDASRKQALDANVTEILARAKQNIRASVIENLNAITASTFVVNELSFIAQCVSLYGFEVLFQSAVPWISLIQQPGDVRQLSSGAFLTMAKEARSIFMAYNTGPWTAIKKWTGATPLPNDKEIALVLDADTIAANPQYISSDEEKSGSVKDLWPGWDDSVLFAALLRLMGEAWQTNTTFLVEQGDWRHAGSTIWGRFKRP